MTIRGTNIFEVAPENMEAFIALIPEARALIEKNGGANVRVFQTTVAGPNTGRILGSVEFDSMAAYGAYSDTAAADPELQALQQKAAGLATVVSTIVATELG